MFSIFIIFFNILFPSDQIPGIRQENSVLIQNAIIHTVSNGIVSNQDLLFTNGKIDFIGSNIKLPPDTKVINASGMHIFPGLISAGSTIGLQEINAVRATRDYAEVGKINPNVRANVSYNPDSELIPVARSNGILLALSVPRSGRISGTSSLMMLDGWTWEDATFKHPVGIHLFWPSMEKPKYNEKEKRNKNVSYVDQIQEVDNLFLDSRAYIKLKEVGSASFNHDLKLEGLLQVIKREVPIFIHANEVRQIEAAVYWSIRQQVNMVLVGGKDSWRIADLLKIKDIPIIYTQTFSQPKRRFEDFDQSYKTPLLLYEKGIRFCISNSESPFQTPHIRNLPYYAAKAASYGLPWDIALRSITLSTAEILGVDQLVGSIEPGKDATFFIADGDILDIRTNVISAYIQGRKVDLNDRHKMLYSKYKQKYKQQGVLK